MVFTIGYGYGVHFVIDHISCGGWSLVFVFFSVSIVLGCWPLLMGYNHIVLELWMPLLYLGEHNLHF
jgi:hypothetical protein